MATAACASSPPPSFTQDTVRASIEARRKEFIACYDAGGTSNGAPGARVVVRFEIDERGRVAHASDAGSDVTDERVIKCVVSEAMHVAFPPPEGGHATIVYPIIDPQP